MAWTQQKGKNDRLLTKKQVIKILGIRSDDKVWTQQIKPELIKSYGMRVMEGGTRILESNLQKYLKEKFKKSSKKFAD